MKLRSDCNQIVRRVIAVIQPNAVVRRALEGNPFQDGQVVLAAVGKTTQSMARAACDRVGGRLDSDIIIIRHGRAQGPISSLLIRRARHLVPDQDIFSTMEEVLVLTDGPATEGAVLSLLFGGSSALFEAPLVPQEEFQSITQSPLASGADIMEMSTIRKQLSAVKGGWLAQYYAPAKVFSTVLPDIIGDPLGTVASGPVYPDFSTYAGARRITEQYGLCLSSKAFQRLKREAPKALGNVEALIIGSMRELYAAISMACRELGYESALLTDNLDCEAREAKALLAVVTRTHQDTERSLAFLAGGGTVVHLTGSGLGEHNQELALSIAADIVELEDAAVFFSGSDGTDGPTDAADGLVDDGTKERLAKQGVRIFEVLKDSDAYHAPTACGGLLHTGTMGTNVNDMAALLIRR